MMKGSFPTIAFQSLQTPFYYYDLDLLQRTLEEIRTQASEPHFHVHYAMKACVHPAVLKTICEAGLGADCVSGGEIEAALAAGIPAERIVYAGVGKADWEIKLALANDIYCFNAESEAELEVINALAAEMGKTARIALRVNPNVDAHTHRYITTGLEENKFGIDLSQVGHVAVSVKTMPNLKLVGLHFHIGSQITDMMPFQNLCVRINELQDMLAQKGIYVKDINVGGGLGINYEHPNHCPIADFEGYFRVFRKHLQLRENQNLHFELGRSVVAPCGTLVTRVLYVKKGLHKQFAVVDAGMTDLIRPALYQAFHRIENLTSRAPEEVYDVVGPICESSDVFVKDYPMAGTRRGDLLAIRSAGAYGEVMASRYNLRKLPASYTSADL